MPLKLLLREARYDAGEDQCRFRERERLLSPGLGPAPPSTLKNQARPASIIATFGAIALSRKRPSGSGASTVTTPKRGACMAAKRRGSAEIRLVSATTARANMKFGTVSAVRRDRPCRARIS